MELLTLPKMTAEILVVGGQFRTTPRQRKNLLVKQRHDLKAGPDAGKILFILEDCKQLVLSPLTEVFPAI